MAKEHHSFEPFELAENMQEDLGMFEAATHSRRRELELVSPNSILIVSDRGPLTKTVGSIGRELSRRLNSRTIEHTADGGQMHDAAREIERIAGEYGAGLIVLPVPCGRGFGESGEESPGPVADRLLQSVKIPVVCVQQSSDELQLSSVFRHLQAVLIRDDQPTMDLINWVFRLADDQSKVRLIELADRKSLEEAQILLKDRKEIASVQKAAIERAVTSRMGTIVSLAQREARTRKIDLQVDFHPGTSAGEILDGMNSYAGGLIMLARPEAHNAPGYQLVVDVLQKSRRSILIV